MLDGNAVHIGFLEAAARVRVSFAVNTIVNDDGAITDIYCGDAVLAHRAACGAYASNHTIAVSEMRENVIVGCGGHPHDINLIQAHKALAAAAEICQPGGEIFLIADCPDGPGRRDFLQWFDAGSSDALAERLCESYKVNGQTAWSLMRITERYEVSILASLDAETCRRIGMKKLSGVADLAKGNSDIGYILPAGAKYLYRLSRG
jgi:nickel-dependent lactate racemase